MARTTSHLDYDIVCVQLAVADQRTSKILAYIYLIVSPRPSKLCGNFSSWDVMGGKWSKFMTRFLVGSFIVSGSGARPDFGAEEVSSSDVNPVRDR